MKKIVLLLILFFLFLFIGNEAFAALNITGTLPSGNVGETYSGTMTVSGGTPPYTWSLKSGTLPPGLNFSSLTGETVEITGTPTKDGAAIKYDFTVRVIDNSAQVASKDFSISIWVRELEITTLTGTPGTIGELYEFTLQAKNGIPPYTWENPSVTGAAQFADYGLRLSTTGKITGVPCKSGTNKKFGIKATGTSGGNCIQPSCAANVDLETISISFSSVPFEITTVSLPSGEVGKEYSATLSARGGEPNCSPPPYSWSIGAGALPTGLNLASDGTITGTPTQKETKDFTVIVTDSKGTEKAQTFSIEINSSSAPGTKTCSELGGICCLSGKSCTSGKISGASDCVECCEDIANCAVVSNGNGGNGGNGGNSGSYGSPFELKNPLAADTLAELIDRFITLIFLIGIVVAPIMFLIGGFYFMTSAGDAIKLDKAKKIMLYAAIGLGIVLLAKALVTLIEDLLGVKETTYFKNLWFFGIIGLDSIRSLLSNGAGKIKEFFKRSTNSRSLKREA